MDEDTKGVAASEGSMRVAASEGSMNHRTSEGHCDTNKTVVVNDLTCEGYCETDAAVAISKVPHAQDPSANSSTADTSEACTNALQHSAALQAESHLPRVGQVLEPGVAFFPVMTQEEVAMISVPASAPSELVRATLAEHGACLVTGVLNPQQCMDFERFWQSDLLGVLGSIKEDNGSNVKNQVKRVREEGVGAWPQAWSSGLGKKGSVSQRGLPHGEFAWKARLHPGVRKVFADIYGTAVEDLKVGMDCIFWSGADTPAVESNVEWLHCDQNHQTGMTWPCFQGVLYVWPSECERASTTVIWPGSHKDPYNRIMEDKTARNRGKSITGQSVRLSQLSHEGLREELTAQAVASSRRVPCPAGSLLLWDSRTIHQGWSGGPRLAQPVCWEPGQRREQDTDALKRKVFMCVAGLPSSHSSAEARVHGMAPRSRPCEMLQGTESPAMRAQIVPYCISEKAKRPWDAAQASLWSNGRNPHKDISDVDSTKLASLLTPEVLNSL